MATNDILTLAEAKNHLDEGQLDVTREDLIEQAVTGLTSRLERDIGPVVQRTITDELVDGGRPFVKLRHRPAASITTVTEASGTSTTVLTAEAFATAGGYLAEPHRFHDGLLSGRLIRRSGFAPICWASGLSNVQVTYEAGRFTTTATVESDYKEALAIMLLNWFRASQDGVQAVGEFQTPQVNFPTFAIPNAVRSLLWTEFRPAIA